MFFVPLLAVAAICMVCTKDYNPFADLTNAKVHVLSWSFSGRDSVALYTTGTLKTVVALREDVDSFSVVAPKNRFWADTTVRRTSQGAAIDGGPYSFSISFYDTGVQTVTVSTYRSNGEVLPERFSVRVFSPLRQDTIKGLFGAAVTLSTPPVPDKDVFYHWNFGGGRKDSSVSGNSAVVFTYFTPTTGNGSLLVTDLSGNHPTPIRTFQYRLMDTTPPVIMCVNSGLKNDTLVTGDSLFAFRAYVADAGNARVDSCTVNRTTFDFANFSTQVYTKLFRDLPDLTKGNVPLAVTVFARDNAQFKNMAQRTFWVVFNPLGVKSADAQIDFIFPLKDSSIAQNRYFFIYGNAQNFRGDSMVLSVKVNDSLYPATQGIPGSGGEWEWQLHLNAVVNKVIVSAYSTDSRFLTSAQRVIYYDPNALDSIKPMLYSITVKDKPINNFYTPDSFVTLKIVAFDQGSGIQAMYLNNDKISQDSAGYIWHASSGALVHRLQGNSMFIRAIDNAGNIKDSTVTIFKNSPPDMADHGIPAEFCIDTSYSFRLPLIDADEDSVTIIKVWAPASLGISKDGTISWKPAAADTGLDSLVIQLYDQYQTSPLMSPKFYVRNCSQPVLPVHFTTTVQDFPGVLQAGVDTLKIRLTVDSTRASSILYYKAWLIDNNQVIKANDTSSLLVWAPLVADTGYRRLRATVGDGASAFDTLGPAIQVVPKNQYPCSLSCRFTGTTTAAGNLDIFSHPAAETLYFTIIDKDNPLTEKYTVTISQHNVNSVEVLNNKDFFIAIKPDSTRILDTLKVLVHDMTNTTDSAAIIVEYRNPALSLQLRLYLNTTSSGAQVAANVLKFPVLVRLTKSNFDFSKAQAAGQDIRFRKPDGTSLPYQIERWDSARGLAEVWVLADTVFGNDSSHYFELYQIGRPAVDGSNAAAVFDTVNSFRGVWHLDENALTIHDATADGFDGARTGNQQPDTGIIGTCQTFDGLNSYTDMGNILDPGNSNFTASVWVKRGGNLDNYSELVGKSTGGNPNVDYGWLLDFDGNNKVHCFMATASGQWGGTGIFDIYSDAAVTDLTQWHYICAVINRSSSTVCKLYIDGAEAASTSRGSITNVGNIRNNVAFRIGAEADNEINFNGSIDEALVSFTARSADWVKLCYMNQKAADALVRIK